MRRFAFRLCLQLGVIHPDHLMRVLTARQLNQWMAYSTLEPFGPLNEWLRTAQIASVTANVNRRKGSKAITPADFMPKERKRQQSASDMKATMMEFIRGTKEQ